MPDYNIFIHSDSKVATPTQPKQMGDNVLPKETEEIASATGTIQQVGSFITNPDSIIGMAKSEALGLIGKTGVVGAIAFATYKITTKTIETTNTFITRASGDYRFDTGYNNYKIVMSAITNPFNSILGMIDQQAQINIANQRKEQQRTLLGDAMINSYSKGV